MAKHFRKCELISAMLRWQWSLVENYQTESRYNLGRDGEGGIGIGEGTGKTVKAHYPVETTLFCESEYSSRYNTITE